MQIIFPEILDEVRKLPLAGCLGGLGVGLLLWLFGWFGHRFWIVTFTTAGAGVLGLYFYPVIGVTSFAASLLLAVSAGVLALSLVRVVAFAGGGLAVLVAMRAWAPSLDEPLLAFLLGGLLGVLLFRLWTMALTSILGTLLLAYFGLSLAEHLTKFDSVALVTNRTVVVNWILAGTALVGLGLQFFLERMRTRRRLAVMEEVEEEGYELVEESRPRAGRKSFRRAG